jgi:hypothetical protein
MMTRKFLIALIVFATSFSFAQTSLGISPFGYTVTDSVTYTNPNFSVTYYIKNTGNAAFTGNATVNIAIDSSSVIILHDTLNITLFSLSAGDSVSYSYSDTTGTPWFRNGVNTVVIWPKANNASTSDTLAIPVFYDAQTGIREDGSAVGVMLFPNPSNNELFLIPLSDKHTFEKIQISDFQGKIIFTSGFQKKTDISHLEPGIYFVCVTSKNGVRRSYKFIQQ